jgi:hypothetical protein
MNGGTFDEMVDHLCRDHDFNMGVDGLIDLDRPCTGEVHQIIALEECVIQHGSKDGNLCGLC